MPHDNGFFCHLPFVNMMTDGKWAQPCCKYSGPNLSLQDYQNHPLLARLKATLWAGQSPKECVLCVTEEANSGKSFRTLANDFHPHLSREVLQNSDTYSAIRYVDVVGSNICNLQCLPCEYGSYKRSSELHQLGFIKIEPTLEQLLAVDEIAELDIEVLTLCSGEPFYDKQSWHLLELLVTKRKSHKIRLDINTNLTGITKSKLEWLIDNFQEVLIKGSVDGYGVTNDYLRYPSDWAQICQAIDCVLHYPRITFVITTALSNLSLIGYHHLLKYLRSIGIKDFFISQVTKPDVLHGSHLSGPMKKQLLPFYIDMLTDCTMTDRTRNAIETCINLCQIEHIWQPRLLVNYLDRHDQRRSTNWRTTWPNLVEHC